MSVIDYPDSEAMALGAARAVMSAVKNALVGQGRATLVVPGGTTPGPVFDALCDLPLEWEKVDILLSDERFVPEGHARANSGLVRGRLMKGRAAAAEFHSFHDSEAEDAGALARRLSDRCRTLLPVSVCLLGMGADGHVASLIPGARGLSMALEDDAPPVVALSPQEGEARVSLSLPALRGAFETHIVISGPEKQAALERARSAGSTEEMPVRAFLDGATVHHAP